MNTKTLGLCAAALLALGSVSSASAKDYQVTGPVLEVNDSVIAVQKGNERWEIARDTSTKSESTPKVGDRVTIMYKMTATKIEVKADKAARAEGRTSPLPAASPQKKQ